jgi:hypothetical protein
MLRETAIPSTRWKQRILLFQGAALLSVVVIITIFYLKFTTFVSYSHSSSRIPEYNEGIIILPFFFFSLWYSGKYLLNNKVYDFQLHPDVLIITSKAVFNKKIDFFYLEKISAISIQKEGSFLGTSSAIPDYTTTTLSIKSTHKKPIKYSFYPSYHELKELKELLKDFT